MAAVPSLASCRFTISRRTASPRIICACCWLRAPSLAFQWRMPSSSNKLKAPPAPITSPACPTPDRFACILKKSSPASGVPEGLWPCCSATSTASKRSKTDIIRSSSLLPSRPKALALFFYGRKVSETKNSTNLLRLGFRRLLFLVCLGLGGALVSATMVRFAPGNGVSERELDPRWRAESVEALRQAQALHQGLPSYYLHYLSSLAPADLGESDSLKRPVLEVLLRRLPVTSGSVVRGLGVAWLGAGLPASLGLAWRGGRFGSSATALYSLLLSSSPPVRVLLAVLFVTSG